EEMSGVRFGQAFFENVAKQRRRLDSDPGARALVAFRRLAPDRSELEFAHALLRANFWDGGDPASDEFYRGLAAPLGLDPETFVGSRHTDDARAGARRGVARRRQLAAGGVAGLNRQPRGDYRRRIARGSSPSERVQAIIDTILPCSRRRRAPSPSGGGA